MRPEESTLYVRLDKVTKVTFGIYVDGDLSDVDVKATLKFPLSGQTSYSVDGIINANMEIEFLVPELHDLVCDGEGEYILELRVGDVVYEPFVGKVVFEDGDPYESMFDTDEDEEYEEECEEEYEEEEQEEFDIYDEIRKHRNNKEYVIELYKTKVLGLSKEIPVIEEAVLEEIDELIKEKS